MRHVLLVLTLFSVTCGQDVRIERPDGDGTSQANLQAEVRKLETYLKNIYYSHSKQDKQWKKHLKCAACQVVVLDLGATVEAMRSWSGTVATEAHFSEALDRVCNQILRFGLVAANDQGRMIDRDSPLRFVDRTKQDQAPATLLSPFIRKELQGTCDDLVSEHFELLVGLTPATPRHAVKKLCVDELRVCGAEEAIETFGRDVLEAGAVAAMKRFLVDIVDEEHQNRKDLSCMACDQAYYHIVNSVGVQENHFYKNKATPSVAELQAYCGEEEDWKEWGLEYNFWDDEVRPVLVKTSHFEEASIKIEAEEILPKMLHNFCINIPENDGAELNGSQPPPKNCHHTHWCDGTQWAGDTSTDIFFEIPMVVGEDGHRLEFPEGRPQLNPVAKEDL